MKIAKIFLVLLFFVLLSCSNSGDGKETIIDDDDSPDDDSSDDDNDDDDSWPPPDDDTAADDDDNDDSTPPDNCNEELRDKCIKFNEDSATWTLSHCPHNPLCQAKSCQYGAEYDYWLGRYSCINTFHCPMDDFTPEAIDCTSGAQWCLEPLDTCTDIRFQMCYIEFNKNDCLDKAAIFPKE